MRYDRESPVEPNLRHTEVRILEKLVDDFAEEMKAKLLKKSVRDGYSGWDDPAWTEDQKWAALIEHLPKGDPVDVANFAAFIWNARQPDPAA